MVFKAQQIYTSDQERPERCFLVGLIRQGQSRWEVEDQLKELRSLTATSGGEVVDTIVQQRPAPDPAFFIGKGKLEEIALRAQEEGIDLIIFDDELSPAQIKNIERVLQKKVIDRSTLILDIFARHARTREAKVQVELAQLNYLFPRLTRQWQHLSRQEGGIGTKGPGETQLETDRRLIRQRIAHLKRNLEKIDHQRQTQRKQRQPFYRVALIGYTNAGKSTLLQTLSGAEVFIADQLFATLDTTVRRVQLEKGTTILLSDTVGFIRKLPHHLVASFRSTLAEAREADLLLHVVDVTHPHVETHIKVVYQLLRELDIHKKKRLLVFNKVDALDHPGLLKQLHTTYPDALFISARNHLGLTTLKQKIIHLMADNREVVRLKIPLSQGHLEYRLHDYGVVLERSADDHFLYLTVKYEKQYSGHIREILAYQQQVAL